MYSVILTVWCLGMLVIRQDFKFQDSRRLLNMKETIVVIGANHGGTAVLNTILDQKSGGGL